MDFYKDIDREVMEYNERMQNESDKHSEYMEMKSMYEECLLECWWNQDFKAERIGKRYEKYSKNY